MLRFVDTGARLLGFPYDDAGEDEGEEGLDQVKARRAVELSIQKYCSVIHSLAPDIRVSYDVEVA